jgi:hypothetical protein
MQITKDPHDGEKNLGEKNKENGDLTIWVGGF